MKTIPLAENLLKQTEVWFEKNGWEGYDPFDVKGQDWFVALFGRQNLLFRKIRGLLAVIEDYLPPLPLRNVLKIKKQINPKGMGLIASAYLSRFRATKNQYYLHKAEKVLDWLEQNRNKNYQGYSWGYPFHWQSRIFIPRGTPSSVVTGTIADAWLDHYLITKSKKSLNACKAIAKFFQKELKTTFISKNKICLSYTPIDDYQCLNATLFVAAFYAKFYKISKQQKFLNMAKKICNYVIDQQTKEGAFYYWGFEPDSIIDHWHTGFTLRHLDTVSKATPNDCFRNAINRGYAFYNKYLNTKQQWPKFTPQSLYPIDIHAVAEAILCQNQIEFSKKILYTKVKKLLNFINRYFFIKNKYFCAEIKKLGIFTFRKKIPYIRWGQAWMFLALARLVEKYK